MSTGHEDIGPFLPTEVLGRWTLARTVVDHAAGETRSITGTTTLTRVRSGRVRWEECGTMTWSGGSVPVSRTLFVTAERSGSSEGADVDGDRDRDRDRDRWMVRFADGRPFHPWRPGIDVVHDCAPDVYRGRIEGSVAAWSVAAWSVVWDVTGPAKDYRMESRLTRP